MIREKLEEYFLKIKIHTELIESEYNMFKEKYYKYKSKFLRLSNQLKVETFQLRSDEKLGSRLENLGQLLKSNCEMTYRDAKHVNDEFSQEEKDVLIDLLIHGNTNSYSKLINKFCKVIYQSKKDPLAFEFSEASEDEY